MLLNGAITWFLIACVILGDNISWERMMLIISPICLLLLSQMAWCPFTSFHIPNIWSQNTINQNQYNKELLALWIIPLESYPWEMIYHAQPCPYMRMQKQEITIPFKSHPPGSKINMPEDSLESRFYCTFQVAFWFWTSPRRYSIEDSRCDKADDNGCQSMGQYHLWVVHTPSVCKSVDLNP